MEGEVERINNLDPVSSGTEVEKGNKYNTNTAQTHKIHVFSILQSAQVMKTAESLSTEFGGLYFTCIT